jgi:hypothetical protein
MSQPQRSARDERYINSTSFEVYMVAGFIWLMVFSGIFVLSVVMHHEMWIWPGGLLSIIAGAVVLNILSRRERRAKIREVDEE